MSAEENKELIRRFVDAIWNGKNADLLGAFHAAQYTQNGTSYSIEDAKERMREMLAEVPDLHHTIEDIIAEGDKVAYRWIMRSTNQATGKQQTYRGITFMRIADGKIVEDWYSADAIE